jgi:hypothetical protein
MVGLQCVLVIRESLATCALPAGLPDPRFCSAECEAGNRSFLQVVTNRTICPGGEAFTVEGSTGATINQICRLGSGPRCLAGTPEEKTNCGFLTLDIAKQQCTNLNDNCCKALLEQIKNDETRRVVIIASCIAGGILLLIIIALVVYCVRKRRREQESSPKGFIVHRAEQVSRPSGESPYNIGRHESQKTLDSTVVSDTPKDYFSQNNNYVMKTPVKDYAMNSQPAQRVPTFTALQQPSPVMASPPSQAYLYQSIQETSNPSSAPVHSMYAPPLAAPLSAPIMNSTLD